MCRYTYTPLQHREEDETTPKLTRKTSQRAGFSETAKNNDRYCGGPSLIGPDVVGKNSEIKSFFFVCIVGPVNPSAHWYSARTAVGLIYYGPP